MDLRSPRKIPCAPPLAFSLIFLRSRTTRRRGFTCTGRGHRGQGQHYNVFEFVRLSDFLSIIFVYKIDFDVCRVCQKTSCRLAQDLKIRKSGAISCPVVKVHLRGEALDVRLLELPERLPDLLAVVQPEVLHEVGLAQVRVQRHKQVHERLEGNEFRK